MNTYKKWWIINILILFPFQEGRDSDIDPKTGADTFTDGVNVDISLPAK